MKLKQKQVITFYQVLKHMKEEYFELSYWLFVFMSSFSTLLLDLNTPGQILLFLYSLN